MPIITKYAKDTVPNIKFVVCKIFKSFATLNFSEKGVKIIKQYFFLLKLCEIFLLKL